MTFEALKAELEKMNTRLVEVIDAKKGIVKVEAFGRYRTVQVWIENGKLAGIKTV